MSITLVDNQKVTPMETYSFVATRDMCIINEWYTGTIDQVIQYAKEFIDYGWKIDEIVISDSQKVVKVFR